MPRDYGVDFNLDFDDKGGASYRLLILKEHPAMVSLSLSLFSPLLGYVCV
jgi:hypothetical protein